MRFFPEKILPTFRGPNGADGYTALNSINMNDADLWDPELLEEDADLLNDN